MATTSGGSSGGGSSGGSGSGASSGGSTGTSAALDSRDGQSYPTVAIGTQTWLAANLNYPTATGSQCYADDPANCQTDGRLYTFAAAAQACPGGWHLPSDDEWKTLETALGMPANQLDVDGESSPRGTSEGTQLKLGGDSGFQARPGGYASGTSGALLNTDGYFWTATQSSGSAWRRHVSASSPYLYRFQNVIASFAISVRCLRN